MKKLLNKLGIGGMLGLGILVFIVLLNLVGCAPSPTVEQEETVPSYTVETINLPEDIGYNQEVPRVLSFSYSQSGNGTSSTEYHLLYITTENTFKVAVYGLEVGGLKVTGITSNPISYIILQGDN